MNKNPAYVADLLFIKLPPPIAEGLFRSDSQGNTQLDLSNWRLTGYLFHEWIHYVHNVSTLNGLYAFASMITMWANFRHKIDARGHSVNDNKLSSYAESSVRRTHLYRKEAARNERNMSSVLRNTSAYVTIYSVTQVTRPLPENLPGHNAENVSVISCDAVSPVDQAPIKFEVGTVEILEGIAFMLEEMLLMANRELPADIRSAPYKLLQSVARHIVDDIENDQVIAAAITALQTEDPPLYLLMMLRDMSSIAVDNRMARLEALAKTFLNIYEPLIEETLNVTTQLFPLSEPMGDYVKELLRVISDKIALRQRAPFFELLILKQIKDSNSEDRANLLGRIMADISCPRILAISQDSNEVIAKDKIYNWGPPLLPEESQFGAQKLHSALHYMFLHLSDEGFVETSQIMASKERKRCPFYSACTHQLRHEQPDLCAHRPWDSLAVPTDPLEACWYRAGVRATRAPELDQLHPD